MDYKCLGKNQSYPTISGDLSTDRAVWGLSVVLWEIAKHAITREMSTIEASYEKRASEERNTQPLDSIVEADRLLLKPAEVAGMMAVGRSKVYEMVRTKEIPSVRLGRSIRVPRKALEQWIAER